MRKTSAPAAAYLYPERVFLPVEVQRLVHVALEAAVVARHVAAQLLPAPVPSLRPQPDRRLLMLLGRCQQPSGHTAEHLGSLSYVFSLAARCAAEPALVHRKVRFSGHAPCVTPEARAETLPVLPQGGTHRQAEPPTSFLQNATQHPLRHACATTLIALQLCWECSTRRGTGETKASGCYAGTPLLVSLNNQASARCLHSWRNVFSVATDAGPLPWLVT